MPADKETWTIAAGILGSILAVGVVGNIVCLYVFHKGRRSSASPCAAYWKCLSLADLYVILGPCLELFLHSLRVIDLRNLNTFWCKFGSLNVIFPVEVSTWITVSVTLDRALCVCYPLKFRSRAVAKWTYLKVAAIVVIFFVSNLYMVTTIKVESPPLRRNASLQGNRLPEFNNPDKENTPTKGVRRRPPSDQRAHGNNIAPGDHRTPENVTTPSDNLTPGNVTPPGESRTPDNVTPPGDSRTPDNVKPPDGKQVPGNNTQVGKRPPSDQKEHCRDDYVVHNLVHFGLFVFWLPFLINNVCNALIMHNMYKHASQLKSLEMSKVQVKTRYSNANHVTYRVLAVSMMHCLTYAPSGGFLLYMELVAEQANENVRLLLNSLYYTNSAVNVFLYCLTGTDFRKDIGDMVSCLRIRGRKATGSSTEALRHM